MLSEPWTIEAMITALETKRDALTQAIDALKVFLRLSADRPVRPVETP